MKTKKQIDEKLFNKIIRTAYCNASLLERIEIYLKMLSSKEIKNLYLDYKDTAKAVHSIKLENIELANLPNKKGSNTNIVTKLISLITLKPINISYASIVLVLSVVAVFLLIGRNNQVHYTQAQLLQGEQEVKYSLAMVGKVFSETENKLNEDIINNKIRKPIKIGIETIKKLYK